MKISLAVILSILLALFVSGCDDEEEEEIEGDDAGECSDEADNDQDGLFDCDDDGCHGSPACDGGDADADSDVDADVDADTDADADADEDGPPQECVEEDDPACDDDNPCTDDSCDVEAGECVNEDSDEGTDCEGTLFCADGETCDGDGNCDPESGTFHCEEDDNPCNTVVCDEDAEECLDISEGDETSCEGTFFCRDGETCDGEGACDHGSGTPHCVDDWACTEDTCDEDTEGCGFTPSHDSCESDALCQPDHEGADENGCLCVFDCGDSECGDGFCSDEEAAVSCPEDCPDICGDGECTGREDASTCARDCDAVCGDGLCTHDEVPGACPGDCLCTTPEEEVSEPGDCLEDAPRLIIHEFVILDDLSDSVWTFSPIAVRFRVSAPDLEPGETADVPLMIGLIPPTWGDGPAVEELEDYLCAMEILQLRGVSNEVSEHEFSQIILQDDCFWEPLLSELPWIDEGEEGYYLANVAVQPLACDETGVPGETQFFVSELADELPNSNCVIAGPEPDWALSDGCVWYIPVTFCGRCFDIRTDDIIPHSSCGPVWTDIPEERAEFVPPLISVTTSLTAYGDPDGRPTPTPLPRDIELLVEYWIRPLSHVDGGDQLLVSVGEATDRSVASRNIAISSFVLNEQTEHVHALYLEDSTVERVVDGDWSAFDDFTIRGCTRFDYAAEPLEADCREFDFTANRSDLPADTLRAMLDGSYYLGSIPWNREYGNRRTLALRFYTHSDSAFNNFGAYSHNEMTASISALSNRINLPISSARLDARANFVSGEAYANFDFSVVGETVVERTYIGRFSPPGAPWSWADEREGPSARFFLGPVPISITPSIYGEMGVDLAGVARVDRGAGLPPFDDHSTQGEITVSIRPYAIAGLRVDVSASVIVASIGVEGDLNVIDVAFPVEGGVSFGVPTGRPGSVEALFSARAYLDNEDRDGHMSWLNGHIVGYVETSRWISWFWSTRREYTVFSFPGYSWSYTLLDYESPDFHVVD